ncbi:DUF4174 domain-containing protein [uncultured Tateyamaria sp.]|uniref:DUF4174 domain-containing protein n=1 Tax=uncultured Tateyamaria sp. TaxID=455651 RepID=UPI00344C9E62
MAAHRPAKPRRSWLRRRTQRLAERLKLKLTRAAVVIAEKAATLGKAGGQMKHVLPIVLVGLFGGSAVVAESGDTAASSIFITTDVQDLNEFVWENRPIVVFADSPNDPNFRQQIEFLEERANELAERDVVVLTDTDPSKDSALRQKLRPRGFMMVLVSKDGSVLLRKPFPWSVRELMRSIDRLPSRQREIRERRESDG